LNKHNILDFLIPKIELFQEKKIHLSEGPFFRIFGHKTQTKGKMLKLKKNTISKIVLKSFFQSKTTQGIANFKN
jgi:hypothetical protein